MLPSKLARISVELGYSGRFLRIWPTNENDFAAESGRLSLRLAMQSISAEARRIESKYRLLFNVRIEHASPIRIRIRHNQFYEQGNKHLHDSVPVSDLAAVRGTVPGSSAMYQLIP